MNKRNKYKQSRHSRNLIRYHIIFVTKYRHKLFENPELKEFVKKILYKVSEAFDFDIEVMEIDPNLPDHIHMLILSNPKYSPGDIVKYLKQYSTYYAWRKFPDYLKKFYWKEHNLWTHGYFYASIGECSEELKKFHLSTQHRGDTYEYQMGISGKKYLELYSKFGYSEEELKNLFI